MSENPFNLDLTAWMMVFLRVSGLFAVFPVFSAPNVPVRIRIALGAATAFLIAPGVQDIPPLPVDLIGLGGRMAAEVGSGLLFGMIARLLFLSLEIAGAVVGTEMGLSLPPTYNPMLGAQASTATVIITYLAIMIWLSLDLHHWLLAALQRSYAILPIGGAHLQEPLLKDLLSRCSGAFVLAMQLSAPIMAISFIISLTFSVLGRAVPQMNVFVESFSIRVLGGLMVFGLTCELMAQHIANAMGRLPEDILKVAALLAQG